MVRLASRAAIVFLAVTTPLRAADDLPPGAIAAFGTDRFLTPATPMAFTADGKRLVGFASDYEIRTWDAGDGKLLRRQRIPGSGAPWRSISAGGKFVAFIGEPRENYIVWDVEAGKELRRVKTEPPWNFHNAVFVSGGKYLVTAESNSNDGNKGRVRRWTLADGTCKVVAEEPFYFQRFTVSPDGKRFAASTNWPQKKTRCWDAESGEALWTDDVAAVFLTFAAGGKTLVACPFKFEKEWRAWDAATGKRADVKLPDQRVNISESTILLAAGDTVLFSTYEGVIAWDLKAGKESRRFPSARSLAAVAPDGKSLLTYGPRWQRWDLETGKPLYPETDKLGHLPIDRVRLSPDGKTLAAVSGHVHLSLWDVKTSKLIPVASPEQFAFVYGLTFTPDGKQLVAAHWSGHSGGFVLVRDLPDGKVARRFATAHVPNAVALTPGAKRAVISSWNNTPASGQKEQSFFVTHDLETGREVAKTATNERYAVTTLSADGRRAVVLGGLFDIPSGKPGHKVIPEADYFWVSGATALSPDGRYYAIHACDRSEPPSPQRFMVVVLEVATGRAIAELKTAAMGQLAFTADVRRLVTADWDGLRVWDLAAEACVLHHKPHDMWDFYGRSMIDIPDYRKQLHQSNGTFAGALDVSADGRVAATGHPDTRILLWDLSKAKDPAPPAPAATAWDDLSGASARGYRTVRSLTAHPKTALELLREKLRPAADPEPSKIKRLIADLDDPSFRVRGQAQTQLAGLGPVALPHLQEALKKQPSAELHKRLEELIAKLSVPGPVSGEDLRRVRAVEVLERIGTPDARKLLEVLAKGAASAASTAEARAALERLGGKP